LPFVNGGLLCPMKNPSKDTVESDKRGSNGLSNGCIYTIVVFIVAIVALVVVSEINEHIRYAKSKTAEDNLRNTYEAAQAYFKENPNGEVAMSVLENRGLKISPNVIIEIINGRQGTLKISSRHKSDKHVFEIGPRGSINPH
jgi:type II secretory pathway pseudopilin PulG